MTICPYSMICYASLSSTHNIAEVVARTVVRMEILIYIASNTTQLLDSEAHKCLGFMLARN